MEKKKLSVLAIFKNETMNLKIWIEHYLWQGVEHFYLIDNNSDDEPLKILKEYIQLNSVVFYLKGLIILAPIVVYLVNQNLRLLLRNV